MPARTDPTVPATLLEPLLERPERAAVFSDLDGTLAPIVDRPEQVAVPPPAIDLLARLAGRFGAVGIVSGRRAADARRIVGLAELTYIGNHGYELLEPEADAPRPAPGLEQHAGDAAAFVAAEIDPAELDAAGLRVEDKGAIVALHWRGADDEAGAELYAERVAARAEGAGLGTHRGRKVLELRPPVPTDKGSALAAVLAATESRTALYAGDDRTDLDAFRALGAMLAAGELDAVLRVGVSSAEGPELEGDADLIIDGVEGLTALLRLLI